MLCLVLPEAASGSRAVWSRAEIFLGWFQWFAAFLFPSCIHNHSDFQVFSLAFSLCCDSRQLCNSLKKQKRQLFNRREKGLTAFAIAVTSEMGSLGPTVQLQMGSVQLSDSSTSAFLSMAGASWQLSGPSV